MKRPVSDERAEEERTLDRAELAIDVLQLLLDALWETFGFALRQREQDDRQYTAASQQGNPDDDLPF